MPNLKIGSSQAERRLSNFSHFSKNGDRSIDISFMIGNEVSGKNYSKEHEKP